MIFKEIIGYTYLHKPLVIVHFYHEKYKKLNCNLRLKVFIMAGQHGDEKYGQFAINRLMQLLTDNCNLQMESFFEIAFLKNANPDGSIQNQRTNAIGLDLNRDHLRLESNETKAIHSFVRDWNPHIIIDIHNYPPRRKHLIAKNLIYYHDIFIDVPTNPASITSTTIDHLPNYNTIINDFFDFVKLYLKNQDILCERYTIVKPSGIVRHSTIDIVDARNSLSTRYGNLTILLEGKNPAKRDGQKGKEHIINAQFQALSIILKWLSISVNRNYFLTNLNDKRTSSIGDKVAIRSKYNKNKSNFTMTFKDSITKLPIEIDLNDYSSYLEVTKYIKLPNAYAVPLHNSQIIEILKRHGFVENKLPDNQDINIEYYYYTSSVGNDNPTISSRKFLNDDNSIIKELKKKSFVKIKKKIKTLNNYIIYYISQPGGHFLAVLLEPRSKYGLYRYKDLGISYSTTSNDFYYPILRIV